MQLLSKPDDNRTILVVDDDANILKVISTRLASSGHHVLMAANGKEALEVLNRHPADMVISDVKMPGIDGQELLREIKSAWPDLPVILLTAYGRIPDAVEAVHQGAADYLTKPFEGRELLAKVEQILSGRTRAIVRESAGAERFKNLGLVTGTSSVMSRFLRLVQRVAPSDVTVLIEGESGTGKELFAGLMHRLSRRVDGPFIVVDCGSTQATLLESELFGHVKGAFTHAVQDKQGLVQAAHQGTLFLDEIGNISPEMQVRLLRFLQEKTVRRLGDTKTTKVDCRVVAATNADLLAMVKAGTFREDLYYRLKVVRLNVPPLRERREDIPVLAEYFLNKLCVERRVDCSTISDAAMQRLMHHTWPGNVRELKHVLEASTLLAENKLLMAEDILLEDAVEPDDANPTFSLGESERKTLISALEKANWIQKDAAEILGISRRAMHYKIRKYSIEIPNRGSISVE